MLKNNFRDRVPLGFIISFILLTVFVANAFAGSSSASSGSYGGFAAMAKKVESKQQSRWTLAEWMAQKDRNRMMDLWLAMYAPSPYEFYVGGSFTDYDSKSIDTSGLTTSSSKFKSGSGKVGAFATVVGLEGSYEHNQAENYVDYSGALKLRLAGNAVQATNFIAHYGVRKLQDEGSQESLSQAFYGGEVNLYLNHAFGLHGMYRSYLETKGLVWENFKAERSEAGIFIDFHSMQIYGNYFKQPESKMVNQVESKVEKTGVMSGVQIYF